MKKTILCLTLVGLLVSCGGKSAVTSATSEPKTDAAAEARIASGKTLYDNKCGNCHRLYEPKENTPEDWVPILKRMQPKAKLSDADMALVSEYILKNS